MEACVKEQKNPTEVNDNVVVSLDYTLKVDGEVVDSSEGMEPLQFIQGRGQIIPGLEAVLYGMEVGERKVVTVSPEHGYGDVDPENFTELPRSEFPAEIPLQPGIQLEMTDQDGETLDATIVSVDAQNVRLDFNHPLAGKKLDFSVEVVALRQPTTEELAHGHVHDENGEELEEEDDEMEGNHGGGL
jgi:FKBP-type peptidyl-prolyl cis-trans isomerase SlyD